jgi:hypothetical protein
MTIVECFDVGFDACVRFAQKAGRLVALVLLSPILLVGFVVLHRRKKDQEVA